MKNYIFLLIPSSINRTASLFASKWQHGKVLASNEIEARAMIPEIYQPILVTQKRVA